MCKLTITLQHPAVLAINLCTAQKLNLGFSQPFVKSPALNLEMPL